MPWEKFYQLFALKFRSISNSNFQVIFNISNSYTICFAKFNLNILFIILLPYTTTAAIWWAPYFCGVATVTLKSCTLWRHFTSHLLFLWGGFFQFFFWTVLLNYTIHRLRNSHILFCHCQNVFIGSTIPYVSNILLDHKSFYWLVLFQLFSTISMKFLSQIMYLTMMFFNFNKSFPLVMFSF